MEKRYYNAETLRADLDGFERRFGIPSEVHFARYRDEWADWPYDVPRFDAFVWADVYREWQRLSAVATP